MRPRRTGDVRPRKPPSDGAPSERAAVLRLALRTPPPTRDALFRAPMHNSHPGTRSPSGRKHCAAARAGTAKPGAKRRQARAKRRARREDYAVGVGGLDGTKSSPSYQTRSSTTRRNRESRLPRSLGPWWISCRAPSTPRRRTGSNRAERSTRAPSGSTKSSPR